MSEHHENPRKCIRCGAEMIEELKITPFNSIPSIVLKDAGLKASAVPIRAALCPECGYVETYIEFNDSNELERILEKAD
ncbi:MAG: nucleic acid-binding protein [Erysipelotrichaceae bacterium]|nr:nucleic acid-binding protein [Erysipelotrichaceae bacterium]